MEHQRQKRNEAHPCMPLAAKSHHTPACVKKQSWRESCNHACHLVTCFLHAKLKKRKNRIGRKSLTTDYLQRARYSDLLVLIEQATLCSVQEFTTTPHVSNRSLDLVCWPLSDNPAQSPNELNAGLLAVIRPAALLLSQFLFDGGPDAIVHAVRIWRPLAGGWPTSLQNAQ